MLGFHDLWASWWRTYYRCCDYSSFLIGTIEVINIPNVNSE